MPLLPDVVVPVGSPLQEQVNLLRRAINANFVPLSDILSPSRNSVPDGYFYVAAIGQSNSIGAGSSDGSAALGGDLYIDQSGGGIEVFNPDGEWVAAEYGVEPLTAEAPDGSLASNHGIAFLNTMRATGMYPLDTTFRLIRSAVGGLPVPNWVALKTVSAATVGQFMMTDLQAQLIASAAPRLDLVLGSQGETDSVTTIADTYTSGPVSNSNKFGNNATGWLSDAVNPTYSWFTLPASVSAAVVAAGGTNTKLGYAAAFEQWVTMLRLLRTDTGAAAVSPQMPILFAELAAAFPAKESARNDYFYSISAGADFDPYVFIVGTAGLAADTSQDAGEFDNENHWTSPAQNILGQRMFQSWVEASWGLARSGIRDLLGLDMVRRVFLVISENIDNFGISQSLDETYYELSLDQMRNGASIRTFNSTIVVPTALPALYGAVDLEIYVFSQTGGPTILACFQEIRGLDSDGPLTVGGLLYGFSYTLSVNGLYRFSGAFGAWGVLTLPLLPPGKTRGGILSVSVSGMFGGGTIAAGAIEATGTVGGVTFGTVTQAFAVDSDATYEAFAAALQIALNAVVGESGWVVDHTADLFLFTISGGTGSIIAVSAFTVTGRTASWGNLLTAAQCQGDFAYQVPTALTVLLPSANAANPGRVTLVADQGGDVFYGPSVGGVFTTTGTIVFFGVETLASGLSVVLEPLTTSRWWPTGGTFLS